MSEAIHLQINASLEHNNEDNLFCPAEPKYHRMFAAGHDVAYGDWKFGAGDGDVVIQEMSQREYANGEFALN